MMYRGSAADFLALMSYFRRDDEVLLAAALTGFAGSSIG